MLRNCLEILKEHLNGRQDGVLADMTFGAGGHSLSLAKNFSNHNVIAVDQDPEAFANGLEKIKELGLEDKLELRQMNFSKFPGWWSQNRGDSKKLDGIIMDLGVSSHHFDSFERGFSFRQDAALDMRMDNADESLQTAAHVLNTLEEEELADVIFEYGEDKFARRIAKKIVEERVNKPVSTTMELENICFHAYPSNLRHKKTHPATRTFQALRIYVNSELKVLSETLPKLYDILNPGGVLIVISFHSLEDRIVKRMFKDIFQTDKNTVKILTKRPLTPSEEELGENARSRSAKLRAIKKLDPREADFDGEKKKIGKKARRKRN
jgi:16S rRNA (cytosine1402-N4)-methyltransferase